MNNRNGIITRKAARQIGREIRKRWEREATKFVIKTREGNRAVSVHWNDWPIEPVIQAIGDQFVTGTDGDGLWFFQTHRNER